MAPHLSASCSAHSGNVPSSSGQRAIPSATWPGPGGSPSDRSGSRPAAPRGRTRASRAGPVPDLVDGGPVVGLPAGEPLRTGQLNAVPPEVVAGAARGRDSDPGDVWFCPGLRVMPNALMTMHLTDSNCLIANRYAVPATLPPRGAHQPPSASSSICASSGSSRFAARTTRGRRSSRCRSQGA